MVYRNLEYPENLFRYCFGDEKEMPDDFIELVEDFISTTNNECLIKEKYLIVFNLRFRENMTYQQISEIINLSRTRIDQMATKIVRIIRANVKWYEPSYEKKLNTLFDDIMYNRLSLKDKYQLQFKDISRIGLLPKRIGHVLYHCRVEDIVTYYGKYTTHYPIESRYDQRVNIPILYIIRQKLGKYLYNELRKFINYTLDIKYDFTINENYLYLYYEAYGLNSLNDITKKRFTIGQLVAMTNKEIRDIYHVGDKGLREIIDVINSYGYDRSYDIIKTPRRVITHPTFDEDMKFMIDNNKLSYNEKLDIEIYQLYLMYRDSFKFSIYATLGELNIKTVKDVVATPADTFYKLGNVGKRIIKTLDYIVNGILQMDKNFGV